MVDYTSKVKIYVIEPLGDKYMAEVTPDDVKMAINKAAQQSASIYRSVQMLYKMIFGSALESPEFSLTAFKHSTSWGGMGIVRFAAFVFRSVRMTGLLCSVCQARQTTMCGASPSRNPEGEVGAHQCPGHHPP